MGIITGESSVELDLPIQRVWEFIIDVEDAPCWQDGLRSLHVTERSADGLPVKADVEVDAKVKTLRSTVALEATVPRRLHITQVSGDLKSVITGWELTDLGDRTRARYYVEVDLGGRLGLLIRGPLVDLLRSQLAGARAGELATALAAGGGPLATTSTGDDHSP